MRVIGLVGVLMLVAASVVCAAPSYIGPSGLILTPDEITTPRGNFSIGYNFLADIDFKHHEQDLNVYQANYGLTRNAEIGVSVLDPDEEGSDWAINGKWRFMDETAKYPAIAVGVLDAFGDAFDEDASFYLLFAKNLTRTAAEVANAPSKPLRGIAGFGTGFFDGIFLGLDWAYTPQWSLMLEYVNTGEDFSNDNFVNAGVRYATHGIRLDLATIDFSDIAFGINYTSAF